MKRLKFLFEQLHLDKTKQLILFFSGNFIFFFIGIICVFTCEQPIGLIFFGMMIAYSLLYISILEEKYALLMAEKEVAFGSFYPLLLFYLKNDHSLHQSLKMLLNQCDVLLRKDLEQWLENMQFDSSLAPYLSFASQFQNVYIQQIILLLFKTQEIGYDLETLENMSSALLNIQDQSMENYIEQEKKKISHFAIYPFLLTIFMMLLLGFFIMQQMKGGLYV